MRKLSGPVPEQGLGRIRTYQELRELFKIPDLATDNKRRRLERFRHAIRKDETRMTKKFFESEPENGRKWEEPY